MKISRLNSIEQYVIKKESVSVDELCEVFNVSKNTIRRDLNELEARGQISKVYGGVCALSYKSNNISKNTNNDIYSSEKDLIGKLAAKEIKDNDVIFIDSGTTVPYIIKYIDTNKKVTIVTHSLNAMLESSKNENITLISSGGIYNKKTGSFLGISAHQTISSINIKKAFISCAGISIKYGLTNSTFLEAEIKRTAIKKAKYVYLVAEHSKINRNADISFCSLKSLTTFITNKKPSQSYLDYFKYNSISVIYQ